MFPINFSLHQPCSSVLARSQRDLLRRRCTSPKTHQVAGDFPKFWMAGSWRKVTWHDSTASTGETLRNGVAQLLFLGGHPALLFGRNTWVRVLNWMKVRSTGKGPWHEIHMKIPTVQCAQFTSPSIFATKLHSQRPHACKTFMRRASRQPRKHPMAEKKNLRWSIIGAD